MATTPNPPESGLRLDRVFRSDALSKMRELLSRNPQLRWFIDEQLVRIFAVVDANIINGELRWRLGKRQKAQARSALEEALDSGVIVLVAPNFLKREIEQHLPDIAEATGRTVPEASQEWAKLQPKLRFYEPLRRTFVGNSSVDPDDLPYKHSSEELAMPVYTRDSDLTAMGAPVVWVSIDMALRDHARARSITVGVTLGSTYSLTIGFEAIRAASELMEKAFDAFGRLPTWAQVAIVGALVAIAVHPKSRAKLTQMWRSVSGAANDLKEPLLSGLLEIADQIAAASAAAEETKREIEAALPPLRKASAVVYARRTCLLSDRALSLSEIARRMRAQGYVSRSRNFEPYLRCVLRKSGQFTEVSGGLWSLACEPART